MEGGERERERVQFVVGTYGTQRVGVDEGNVVLVEGVWNGCFALGHSRVGGWNVRCTDYTLGSSPPEKNPASSPSQVLKTNKYNLL